MKILQIINSHALQDGGAQRLALELHRAYRARGHDAHLLSLMRAPTEETATHSLGFDSPYRAAVLPRLLRFLRQKRWRDVEIIHVHLFPAQPLIALAMLLQRLAPRARFLPRAHLVTTEHNTFNRRRASKLGRALDRVTLRAFEKIICISDATQRALQEWQPQTRPKLVTISNGIDLTRFPAAPRRSNAAAVPIILAVGRISAQKNYATALRAMALLDGNFRFQIAGQDEMDGQMQGLAQDLGLSRQVEFLGYQNDIPALLAGADIFLLCSYWEGFGLAVAEAMAAGLPVVVPDVPGVREVVISDQSQADNGEVTAAAERENGGATGTRAQSDAGFLIDPESPPTIAAALSQLLSDADLRQNLGAKARARAAHFDIERTIEKHLQLFERLGETAR